MTRRDSTGSAAFERLSCGVQVDEDAAAGREPGGDPSADPSPAGRAALVRELRLLGEAIAALQRQLAATLENLSAARGAGDARGAGRMAARRVRRGPRRAALHLVSEAGPEGGVS